MCISISALNQHLKIHTVVRIKIYHSIRIKINISNCFLGEQYKLIKLIFFTF